MDGLREEGLIVLENALTSVLLFITFLQQVHFLLLIFKLEIYINKSQKCLYNICKINLYFICILPYRRFKIPDRQSLLTS